ncbi:hypothetical protein BJ165DRAFT_1097490 [Panaeolus papilionaceus]|nr:hypothetical protein BJ165DRAFT_1097490 [Panaeolus papilionaceus]
MDPGAGLVSEDLWAMFVVRCTCCSALSILTWEWLLSLPFEVSTIWNSSSTFATQILYFISRYLGLIAVIADSVLVSRIHAVTTIDPKLCRWWLGSRSLTAIILLFGLEFQLTMRVLALYGQSKRMMFFLCGLLASKTLAMVVLAVLMVQDYGFGSACTTERVPVVAIYICALQMINQAMIWWLTLLRHWQFVRHSRSSSPLLKLVTRDGSWVFLLLTLIFIVALVASVAFLYGGPFSYTARYLQLIFPSMVAILSFSTCRIIINLQNLVLIANPPRDHYSDNEVQFTTLILSSLFREGVDSFCSTQL